MNNNEKITRLFQQFAEDKLSNHVAELNTRYENERLGSNELKHRAYQDHRKIYAQELDEKIDFLLRPEKNDWLRGELQNLRDEYLNRLAK